MARKQDQTALTADEAFGKLTRREQEVAALISQGLSNDEIAQQLVVTPGTVANHVSHILAKTGARTRVHVAVKMVRTQPRHSADDVLSLLRRLELLGPTDMRGTLEQATGVLALFFGADAADAFVYDPTPECLAALASSDTLLAERQRALALQQLPLSHGGRVTWVFQQQQPFCDGRVDDDAFELDAVRRWLGIRSTLAVPFAVSAESVGCWWSGHSPRLTSARLTSSCCDLLPAGSGSSLSTPPRETMTQRRREWRGQCVRLRNPTDCLSAG